MCFWVWREPRFSCQNPRHRKLPLERRPECLSQRQPTRQVPSSLLVPACRARTYVYAANNVRSISSLTMSCQVVYIICLKRSRKVHLRCFWRHPGLQASFLWHCRFHSLQWRGLCSAFAIQMESQQRARGEWCGSEVCLAKKLRIMPAMSEGRAIMCPRVWSAACQLNLAESILQKLYVSVSRLHRYEDNGDNLNHVSTPPRHLFNGQLPQFHIACHVCCWATVLCAPC